MGILDLSPQTQDDATNYARGHAAQNFPAGFGESFDASWNEGRLFNQSIAGANARSAAISDYADEVNKAGGNVDSELSNRINISGEYTDADRLDAANAALAKAKAKNPSIPLDALDDDGLDQRAIAKSRLAQRTSAEMGLRDKTAGGLIGGFLGSTAAAMTDPVNLVAMAVAPEEGLGVLATGLRWGAIAGASQAAVEAAGAPYREAVQPGYGTSGQPAANILESGLFGGVTGGAFKGLGNIWTRVKTGAWPRSVRDAGNIVESEANIQQSNVFAGAEGDAAHRQALMTAIDHIMDGVPVNVDHIITPEIEAASRDIITRLEGERGMALPIFDERAVRLTSEEAGLRERDSVLQSQLQSLPEGNPASAERLARVQAVEQQAAQATGTARKTLMDRRDELLADTTPEKLRAEAAPIELQRQANTERASIAQRLSDIGEERAKIDAEAMMSPAGRPMLGQREPARPVPFEAVRAHAAAATEAATAERVAAEGKPAPELPFEATAKEGKAEVATQVLGNSIRQIAEGGGHFLSPAEISALAERMKGLNPDQALEAARNLQVAPHQMADIAEHGVSRPFDEDAIPPSSSAVDEIMQKALDNPEAAVALRTQLEQQPKGADMQVHMDADENGQPISQSLGSTLRDIDNDRAAADAIEGCINPAPEPTEAE